MTPRELQSHVGGMAQLAGIELVQALDGPERGVRKAFVRNGGLEVTVHLDRGFDLGEARFRSTNLTWRSPVGAVHPHAHQEEDGWLRRFAGGLLTTCGLDNVGPTSAGRPLHGRYSNLPGTLIAKRSFWKGERYFLELVGEVRDYALFGPDLVLTRRLIAGCDPNDLTHNHLIVEDVIENQGFTPQPLMLLYHCNFGYPLLAAGSQLHIEGEITPRDEAAASGLDFLREMHGPCADYREQVFHCDLATDEAGRCEVKLTNPALTLSVRLRFLKAVLPHLTLWKQLGQGAYVLGLEPGTCGVLGYAREQELGRVRWLAPGERYETRLEVLFSQSEGGET
jgi:gamma-glutamylcyclotransferase (GGCT)/AIG2-like uncharacterized protein YtfP